MYSPKSNQVGTYAYPAGNVSSKDDGSDDKPELYYSGRAFLGKCLLSHADWEGIIAFGRHRDELGAWESVRAGLRVRARWRFQWQGDLSKSS